MDRNGRLTTISRSFNLYSTVQRADDIIGVLPESAGDKSFGVEEVVKLINPRITAEGYKIGNREQGCMIQVSIPANLPLLKEFDYNAEVEIINPVADTVATATFQGADVDWYIKAEEIVLNKGSQPAENPQNHNQQG